MGVPKFFRWLSERYPKINQRFGSPPDVETTERYFDGKPPPPPFEAPDPLSTCGLPPEVDRLYLDMNGIIHCCSHNNSDQILPNGDGDDSNDNAVSKISNEDKFRNVCYYLDRVIGDMVQPKQVVYMAIDGVAPRAKLNQQRSRRYRSGTEGEIETNIYDAHAQSMKEKERQKRMEEEDEDDASSSEEQQNDGYSFFLSNDKGDNNNKNSINKSSSGDTTTTNDVKEVSPGRFQGKFETHAVEASGGDADTETFHSNIITPGTPFFSEFTRHLEHFVKYKLSTDPKWQHLTIIFSGPNVPGEGEHKIMQFIREQKQTQDYNPNLRHCIMGQDGDLVMLGLATHEPNLVLLRERVVFDMTRNRLAQAAATNALDSKT
jgi:5'-3' exonuclease